MTKKSFIEKYTSESSEKSKELIDSDAMAICEAIKELTEEVRLLRRAL